jgi:hypothetical protein
MIDRTEERLVLSPNGWQPTRHDLTRRYDGVDIPQLANL